MRAVTAVSGQDRRVSEERLEGSQKEEERQVSSKLVSSKGIRDCSMIVYNRQSLILVSIPYLAWLLRHTFLGARQ